jgi:NACalpha-BTF3-like transcription factor
MVTHGNVLFQKKDDVSEMEKDDIILILPQPRVSRGTVHTQALKSYGIDFISFDEK